jgi:hypothetical protein
MQRRKQKLYIPDVYLGFLPLSVIGIIALASGLLLPWAAALIDFKK